MIDGKPCQESDILGILGIRLSHPPLRAPILGQHTLGYLFSASPTDRAAFFRAVLDTQDLEDCRAAVAALQTSLVAPVHPELQSLSEVEAIPALTTTIKNVRNVTTKTELSPKLLDVTTAMLGHIGILPAAQELAIQVGQIESELETRRSKAFPLELFRRRTFTATIGSSEPVSRIASAFLEERAKVQAETQRLLALFKAALAIPPHPHHHSDTEDCPLCGTSKAFNAERIAFITDTVQTAESYVQASDDFVALLRSLLSRLDIIEQSVRGALPKFISDGSAARREVGFRISKIKGLLGSDQPSIAPWLVATRQLVRAQHRLLKAISAVRGQTSDAIQGCASWDALDHLEANLAAAQTAEGAFASAIGDYDQPAKAVGEALKVIVDHNADIEGWESLIDLACDPAALWAALQSAASHTVKIKALEKAVRDIDTGNGKVLDEKFGELSAGIMVWWDKLRPNEGTFFSAVQRRGEKTKRNIDLKAGLSAHEDRSNPTFRDAVAVFSQSQLHCLGLSIFLARSVQEKTGFVIMDDPVLTSDDDYRPNFTTSVMEELLDKGVQVIICTQDHKSWKDIGTRWGHRGVTQYQIVKNDAVSGTEIRSEKDDLAAMIAKAQPMSKSQDPILRKECAQRIRDAIERFGKCVLVKDRVAKGDAMASITDYDGKNFGTYSQQVANLLTKDASHPGKLKTAYGNLTPARHDDKPPSQGEIASALGDLRRLKKDYLD